MEKLGTSRLRRATLGTCWDLGNEVLYKLCREYPRHDKEEEILAKVWLVGRSYSAAIERRRKLLKATGEKFYTDVVGPKMRKAKIDNWLRPLYGYTRPAPDNCFQIITTHKKLTSLFKEISGLEKRSLASKYLHFHFPDLFYIYDSRAASALTEITARVKKMPVLSEYDPVYAGHFLRCMEFVIRIEREYGIHLSPRRLDDYLLELS